MRMVTGKRRRGENCDRRKRTDSKDYDMQKKKSVTGYKNADRQ